MGNFAVKSWRDDPDPSTPISAAALMDLEQRGAAYVDAQSAVAIKTAAYSMASTDRTILANATAGAFTVTLPTAAGFVGRITVTAVTAGTNKVTVAAVGSQTISGAATVLLGTAASGAPFVSVTLVSDGSNWWVV